MRYKPYPKYKESGVAWLGEVPEGWEILPLKYVVTYNDDVLPDNTDKNYQFNYIDIGSVDAFLGIIKSEKMIYGKAPSRAKRKVQIGDIIISTVRTYLRAIATIDDKYSNSIVSTGFVVIRPKKEFNSKFASYILKSNYFVETVVSSSVGISYPAINASDLVSIPIVLPRLEEQKNISNYLDQKTQKIDTLIEKQQTLIKLLKEKRQALISHAVTKGLDDTVKMKDSGVAWLGDVPEGWIVTRLKYLTRLIIDGAHFTPTYVDDGIPFLRVTDLHNQIIDKEKTKYIPLSEHKELIKRCNPKRGDLLLSKNGTIGLTKIIDWDWDFSIFVSLCLIKFRIDKLKAEYFSYIFQSSIIEEQLTNSTKKTSVMNLHLDKINELYFIVPSILEQEEIISYLDQKTNQIDTLISKSTQAIELLKERRSALISAVVTGKVDVRNDDRGEENEL